MCVSIMKVENFSDGTCVRACMCVSIMVGENFWFQHTSCIEIQHMDRMLTSSIRSKIPTLRLTMPALTNIKPGLHRHKMTKQL